MRHPEHDPHQLDESLSDERGGVARRSVLGVAGAAGVAALELAPSAATAGGVGASSTVATGSHSRGSSSVTVTMDEVTNLAASVSPDGRTAVLAIYGMLWTVPIEGGTATRLTPRSREDSRPAWDPTGGRIAFQSYDGHYHVWTVRPDGGDLQRLTSGDFDHREPAWSSDGESIAFSSDRAGDGSLDIWSIQIADHELTRWTASESEEFEPAWGPGRDEVTYVSGTTESPRIRAVDSDGSDRSLDVEGRVPSWSPDGQRLAVWHDGRIIVDGDPITAAKEDVFTVAPGWTSTGSLLYTADGRVWTRQLDGGRRVETPFRAGVPLARPSWQPRSRTWDSRAAVPVTGLVTPRLSPDGRSIAFVALGDVYVMKRGRPTQVTKDQYWAYDVEWARDGRSITYTSDRAGTPDVYRYVIATGEEEQLTDGAGAKYGASLSPDGKRLAYLDEDNGLHVRTLASGAVESFGTSPGGELWEGTSWSPDGRRIALADGAFAPNTRFREDYNSIWVLDTKTGERTPHAPAERGSLADLGDGGPAWSPDGRFMAFVMESTLWILPVDRTGAPTGPARQVTTDTADSVSWSGDSRRLLHLHHGRLRSIGIDGHGKRYHEVPLRYRNAVQQGQTIIHAGRLWDGTSDRLRTDVDVTVRQGRITSITKHQERGASARRGARFIDASDQTVVPGMFEMHSHPQDMRYYGTKWWSFYLSMGVTSTVSMGGFLNESVAVRESLASGRIVGPRLFFAGELIDGSRVSHPETRAIVSDEQLERELRRQRAMRPDLFKTYVRTSPKHMERVAQVAHEDGVPVFSHILPTTATLGLDGTSHFGATQRAGHNHVTSPEDKSYKDVVDIYSKGKLDLVVTPFESSALLGLDPDLARDDRVQRLLPAKDVARVERDAANRPTADEVEAIADSTRIFGRIVRAGGRVSTGTDAPLAVPGVQNHMALRSLVAGGMTAAEALRTVTSVAAETMGVGADLGSIEEGKMADLVFIDGDPLKDIDALTKVDSVMKGGELITRADLLGAF